MGLENRLGNEDRVLTGSIKYAIRHWLIPKLGENKRREYEKQVDEASIIPYVAFKGLYQLLSNHPRNGLEAVLALANWGMRYYNEQQYEGCRYLIYTQKDNMIPFRPEEDTMYAYMLAQLAEAGNVLADTVSTEVMSDITKGFIRMNELGAETFRQYPTIMPRFLNHNRLTLKVVQELDRPYNCCPSLHIAYSLYMYNVCKEFLKKSKVKESFRHTTKCMFNSVLYTKQHSMIDIAFGMLCAKKVFEQEFCGFDDMRGEFAKLKKENTSIGYGNISSIYEEITDTGDGRLSFILGTYLRRHLHPVMDAELALSRYFDTDSKSIKDIIF